MKGKGEYDGTCFAPGCDNSLWYVHGGNWWHREQHVYYCARCASRLGVHWMARRTPLQMWNDEHLFYFVDREAKRPEID